MKSGKWLRLSQPLSLGYIAIHHPPGADAANGRIIRMGEGRETSEGRETKRSHRSCLSAARRRAGAPRTSNPENHRKPNLIFLLRYFRKQRAVKQTCLGPLNKTTLLLVGSELLFKTRGTRTVQVEFVPSTS